MKYSILLALAVTLSIKPMQDSHIFDGKTWNQQNHTDFTHYKSAVDNQIRPINGAGVIPVINHNHQLYFLLMVATVENGKDPVIGKEPVYINPSNYPLIDPKAREDGIINAPFETALEIAAHPDELGVLGKELDEKNIKEWVETNGQLIPNAGLLFGRFAVPSFLVYIKAHMDIPKAMEQVREKIAKHAPASIFISQSSMPCTDCIHEFALIEVSALLNAIKEHAHTRMEKPLAIHGYAYKLSPYVARTFALNRELIEENLKKYNDSIKK